MRTGEGVVNIQNVRDISHSGVYDITAHTITWGLDKKYLDLTFMYDYDTLGKENSKPVLCKIFTLPYPSSLPSFDVTFDTNAVLMFKIIQK